LNLPGADPLEGQYGIHLRSLLVALTRSCIGWEAEARGAYQEARPTMEAMVAERPDDPSSPSVSWMGVSGLPTRLPCG
jgi:hypothetical protein